MEAASEPDNQHNASHSDADTDTGPNSLMTTKELQEYWRHVKSEDKTVKPLFEIPTARIVEDYCSKYVMYQVIIIKTGSFDESKSIIERRYSDFEKLHRTLLRDFKEEMEEIVFPRKRVTGNFTEEMINERKLALQDYLGALYSVRCIRRSADFIDFFTKPQLEEAYSCLRGGQYADALDIFLHMLNLQEKLSRHCPDLTVPTLCAILVCHRDLQNLADAFSVGEKALLLLHNHHGHEYYMPLLEAMIILAYQLGKDYVELQEKLREGESRKDQLRAVTLKELAVQEYMH
ncbi:sorting nexin-20 isoform X1 [Lissotriton helveticus]